MLFVKFVQALYCPAELDGLVLNVYTLKNCEACKALKPIIQRLEENDLNIKIRKVECNECDCKDIDIFPTMEITDDKKLVDSSTGYKDHPTLLKWIYNSLKIDLDNKDLIFKITKDDMNGGFSGNWLLFFYDKKDEPFRKVLPKLARTFPDVKIGEVNKKEASDVEVRFNIYSYPHLVAMNNGIAVPYTNSLHDLNSVEQFVKKLDAPVLRNLNYDDIIIESKLTKEPLYIVVNNNEEMVKYHFNELALQFKFKAKIFRSNDPVVFAKTDFTPKDKSEEIDEMLKLFVYKDGIFHSCPFSLKNGDEVIHWIFHTHFPHLSELTNENFYSIFHGIKPVLLLLTEGNMLTIEFEEVARDLHGGMPTSTTIFAQLDNTIFPAFKSQILPDMEIPSLTMFDPLKSQWYFIKDKITTNNIREITNTSIDKFFKNKLTKYPFAKTNYLNITLISLGILSTVLLFVLRRKLRYSDKEE
ncbi:hypothetical protein A0H76_274 [Hepatospora eriocheir]|uniref:Thioredoxin domain-containing protein n=1 Tax=Hepatospora eriocheir TaxID=1081669 RepID=A0A1X0QIZ4_9MICR|nr:hypothetical protein A0H76_274 [Hepatospora eriocheir]